MDSEDELLRKVRAPTISELHDKAQRTYDYYVYPTGPGSRGCNGTFVPATDYLWDMEKALRLAGDTRPFERG